MPSHCKTLFEDTEAENVAGMGGRKEIVVRNTLNKILRLVNSA